MDRHAFRSPLTRAGDLAGKIGTASRWCTGLALVGAGLAGLATADEGPSPLAFEVAYTSELWRNLSGGIAADSVYLDNLDATLTIDAERLWGWNDTRIFLYALYNNGNTLSEDKVGDLQVVSNIETGVEALRLYEAWIETPLGSNGNGSLLFGLFDLNSEFDVLETSGLFINSAHGIGTDFGQTGPSIFPVTSLALRFHWRWNENWGIRAAVFDGVPGDPDDPGATTIQLGNGDGALLVSELEWRDDARRILAGAWRYTADFDKWPRSGDADNTQRGNGNSGVYLRGETRLGDSDAGVRAFARVGVADSSYNVFSSFLSAGVTWARPIHRRPRDTLGLAVAWAEVSEDFQRVEGTEEREIKLELTYQMPLNDRLTLQPDLQYIINPGLEPSLDHAWTLGLRIELGLGR